MTSTPRIRWLHPLTIVCGLILVSEAAVVGYESCAGPPSQAKEGPASSTTATSRAVPAAATQPTVALPAATARPARVAEESPAVPRSLQQPSPPATTAPPLPPPEAASAALASATRTADNEISVALRNQISKLEEELRSGDAGDVESKQKQLVQARSSLQRLQSGQADGPGPTRGAASEPEAGTR